MYRTKKDVLADCPELEITEFGDFVIKQELVKDYEIIDFHCHLFAGLKELFPKLLRKEVQDMEASFFNQSCFPFSIKQFDINRVCFTSFPQSVGSIEGINAKIKLHTGGFVIRKATPQRMLRDMQLNGISKAVVLQINPSGKNSSNEMHNILRDYNELMTFGSIHPDDSNILSKIDSYLAAGIMGWKMNPHVCGFNIDSKKSIDLVRMLADTNLPILSCSGIAAPHNLLKSKIFSKKQKREMQTQRLNSFHKVLKIIPNNIFVFAHGGIFEVDELIKLMREFPNTYTDISTQPSQNIKKLIDKVGSERLLFGTDYPFFNHAFSIASTLRATSHYEERKNIFSQNALNILKS